jgi:GGDEF domain-containing protein/PAS domain-containing protein
MAAVQRRARDEKDERPIPQSIEQINGILEPLGRDGDLVPVFAHRAALRALLGLEPCDGGQAPAPGFEQPAIWVGEDPADARRNPAAIALYGQDGVLDTAVLSLVADVKAANAARTNEIRVNAGDGQTRSFVAAAVPQHDGVLVLAHETTRAIRQIQTLKASREMFRDVALSAGGMAFETDEKGLFRWIGPGKPLGFGPEEMLGRAARDFTLPESPDAFDPFAVREPVDDAPVWFQSLDQGPRALRVSIRPVFDAAGVWRGVRGHARDETTDLRFARRDQFSQMAVEAMRHAASSKALVSAIAAAAAEACSVREAWLFLPPPDHAAIAQSAAAACEMLSEIAARTLSGGEQTPALFAAGEWTGLAMALKAQGEVQAALLIGVPAALGAVSRDAHEMLRLIAPMASVAAMQARQSAMAKGPGPRDALTCLLTADGWREGLAAALRHDPIGAVLAVECDRFKAFGDGLGRPASDELVIEIARALAAVTPPDGLCARLEEATFALWLPNANAETAVGASDAIANAFRTASRRMSLALAATPIVGMACVEAGYDAPSAEELTARAMQGVVAAKRNGRGRPGPPCLKT